MEFNELNRAEPFNPHTLTGVNLFKVARSVERAINNE
jgi:hypothetical protein